MKVKTRSAATAMAQGSSLATITEAQLQAAVIDLARSLGYGATLSSRKAELAELATYGVEPDPLTGLVYHPRYSLGSEPGWPDLTLIRRRDRRLVFAELKSEKGVLSPRQTEVLDLLGVLAAPLGDFRAADGCKSYARIEVWVWRPSDLASGLIAEVLR